MRELTFCARARTRTNSNRGCAFTDNIARADHFARRQYCTSRRMQERSRRCLKSAQIGRSVAAKPRLLALIRQASDIFSHESERRRRHRKKTKNDRSLCNCHSAVLYLACRRTPHFYCSTTRIGEFLRGTAATSVRRGPRICVRMRAATSHGGCCTARLRVCRSG